MAANNLGTAYIKIAPQMEGIQGAITKGLQSAAKSSVAGATALGTVVAKGMSTAMNAVTNSMDRAIARVDTLNAFPKIMKNLGFSTEESTSAIEKLSNRIEGLPTGLDEIVNYTQRLASTMGNLNKGVYNATNLAIAFNDAALAGGKGQYEANRAFEQFSQVLSRGRPSMQDWKIMMEVMPGQLKQMAKYMGTNNKSLQEYAKNAKKTVDQLDGMDLYNWISENKNEKAKERLQDFTKALVDLDNKGGAGITSFKNQVGDATHTIGNALRLIPLRISKAMAEVIQEFGAGDVYNAIDKFTSKFKDVGKWIAKNIVPIIKNQVVPVLKTALGVVKSIVEYIAANKWIQNTIMGIVTAMLAFKAVSTVKSIIVGVITPVVTLTKNLITSVGAFKEAWSAGLSFSSALGNVAKQTTGVTSNIAGMGQTLTASHGAVGGLASKFLGLSAAIGGAVLAYEGIKAMIIIHDTQVTESITKMREYERAHYSVKQAVDSAKRAIDLQKQSIQDLKTAEMAATDAEIAAIEARRQATYYQQEMNRLKAEGKQNTDDYRLAELNYTKAVAEEEAANKKLAESQAEVKDTKQQIDDLNSANLYKANLVIGTIMKEKGEYGNLAAQLDALKEKTITYKDEQGNMVTASKEKAAEMVAGLSEQLARGNEVWRAIVDKANSEGISFSEACKKYGKEAGEGMVGNFSTGFKDNYSMVAQTGKETKDKIIAELKAGGSEAYSVGKNITQGAANGIDDAGAKQSLFTRAFNAIKAAIAKMRAAADEHSPSKETAEIGKFMSLGLAKGIDDYADEAVKSAQEMTQKTIDAMSGSAMLNGNIAQFQPQTALTSGMNGSGGQVIQNNEFYVDSELDVKDVSKRLGWQVATAL